MSNSRTFRNSFDDSNPSYLGGGARQGGHSYGALGQDDVDNTRGFPASPRHYINASSEDTSKSTAGYSVQPLFPADGKPSRSSCFGNGGWIAECLALIAGLLLQAALVGILLWMQNKPLHQWTDRLDPLTLNAAVSTLTTAAKSLMLFAVGGCLGQLKWLYFKIRARPLSRLQYFDEAAKGPFGALKILLRVRWAVAYLGALVVLLSLFIDPFAQQIITQYQQNVTLTDPSVSFRINHNYTSDASLNEFNGATTTSENYASTIANVKSYDVSMQGAIIKGLYGLKTVPQYNCPANCTWADSYWSLGFDLACSNVTQATLETQKCSKQSSTTVCNMTTPGNVSLSTSRVDTFSMTNIVAGTKFQFSSHGEQTHQKDPLTPLPVSPEVLKLAVWHAGTDEDYSGTIGEEVVECSLRLAAYQYSNVNAIGSNFSIQSTKVPLVNGTTFTGLVTQGGAVVNGTWYTFTAPGDDSTLLSIGESDYASIIDFFASPSFTGSTIIGSNSKPDPGIRAPFTFPANLTDIFSNVADTMTEYMRSGPGSTTAQGQRVESVVYVRVRWYWLALPVFSQLAATVLLLWVMVSNRSSKGIDLLKDSSLALLLTTFNPSDGTMGARNLGEINKASRVFHAKLL